MKKLAVVVVLVILLVVTSVAMAGDKKGFDGAWETVDPFDGSYEVMIIESSYPHFSYTDYGATACGTDGDGSPLYPAVIEGDPVISGDTLTVSGMVVCMGDSPYFLLPDPFVLVFTYDKQSDTIGSDMPSFTEIWTRIGKK